MNENYILMFNGSHKLFYDLIKINLIITLSELNEMSEIIKSVKK